MKLTLGAIPYGWGLEACDAFYAEAADSPADTVVIGETLCSKRLPPIDRIATWAEMLTKAGKEVRLGSLCLVTNDDEMNYSVELARLPYPVEVNHTAILELCLSENKAFGIGPHMALYNYATAERYVRLGARGIALHPELTLQAIRTIRCGLDSPVEVLGFGRLPLSISWRCFTARACGVSKRSCEYVCRRHPEGIALDTVDRSPLWIANGTQIMSALHFCLLEQMSALVDAGVSAVRIDPYPKLAMEALRMFRQADRGIISPDQGIRSLAPIGSPGFCNGWFFGREGTAYVGAA